MLAGFQVISERRFCACHQITYVGCWGRSKVPGWIGLGASRKWLMYRTDLKSSRGFGAEFRSRHAAGLWFASPDAKSAASNYPGHHSRDVRSVPVSTGGEFTPSRLTTDANLIFWA